MKNKDVMNIFSAYQDLGATRNVPARLAYAIAKNVKKLEKEMIIIEELRISKAKKLGKLSEDGKAYIFEGPEDQKAFTEYLTELMEQEITLEIHKLQLKDLESINVTPNVLANLLDFIEE